jgi:hypothetical protein
LRHPLLRGAFRTVEARNKSCFCMVNKTSRVTQQSFI